MNQFQHIRSQEFVALENKLPIEIRRAVAKQFRLLQTNQSYPSLRFIVKHENKLTLHDSNTTFLHCRGWVTQPLRSTKCPNNYGLYYKKVLGRWSLRITHNYRALGYRHENTIMWYWVGTHTAYERQISKPL